MTNKGNEATPYLQYIIDNYDNLPETIVFSHGHQCVPLLLCVTPPGLPCMQPVGPQYDAFPAPCQAWRGRQQRQPQARPASKLFRPWGPCAAGEAGG